MGSRRADRNRDTIGTSFPTRAPRVARIGILLRLSFGDEEGVAFLVLVSSSSRFGRAGFWSRWRGSGSLRVDEVKFGVVIYVDEKATATLMRGSGGDWIGMGSFSSSEEPRVPVGSMWLRSLLTACRANSTSSERRVAFSSACLARR